MQAVDDTLTACMRLPSTGILTAFAKKDESMVYTGGNDQLTEIVLGGIDAETAGMGVTLTRLMVNGEIYQPEEQSIGRMAAITLPHDRNNLTFMMSDLPFLNKPQHLYAYRLEGHRKKNGMIFLPIDDTATMTALPTDFLTTYSITLP